MLKNVLRDLRKKNKTNIKSLDEKHQLEINKCIQYVRSKGITLYETEMFRKDLISMYFEREIRNEPIDMANTKAFCDNFINNCSMHKLEPILYTLYLFASTTLFYFVFDLLFSDASNATTISIFRDSLTLIVIVLSYFILPRFTLTITQNHISINLLIFLCVFIAIMIVVLYIFSRIFIVLTFPLWERFAFHCLFFIIMLGLWDKYNYNLSKSL